jgi:hypothetical protein
VSDYRAMFDYTNLRSWHLGGLGSPDATVTIERVEAGVIETEENGKRGTKRVPFVYFAGYPLPLGLNKTNGASFALMYGKDTATWPGKRVTLYVTTCTNKSGQLVECIRVRPTIPEGSQEVAELLHKPTKKVA